MTEVKRYRTGMAAAALALALVAGACRGNEDERARSAANEAGERAQAGARQVRDATGDGWLTTKIQAQYFADQEVKGRNVDVTARDGVVTLSGAVESERARQRAVEIARGTDGVQRVEDQLSVAAGDRAAAAGTSAPAGSQGSEGTAPTSGTPSTGETAVSSSSVASGQAEPLTRIRAEYFSRPSIRHSDITVAGSGTTVTLRGRARSEALKQEALSIARATPGVERVDDQVRVDEGAPAATSGELPPVTPAAPAAGERPSAASGSETLAVLPPQGDEWIEAQIQAKFFKDPLVKNASVGVRASNGTVTLDGQVPSQQARDKALELARQTNGVTSVVDELTIGR